MIRRYDRNMNKRTVRKGWYAELIIACVRYQNEIELNEVTMMKLQAIHRYLCVQ